MHVIALIQKNASMMSAYQLFSVFAMIDGPHARTYGNPTRVCVG